jgi:uncharacterized protein
MAPEPDELPTGRLAPRARLVWRARLTLHLLLALIFGAVFTSFFDGVVQTLSWVPAAVLLIVIAVVPGVRWRRWRWAVHETEIDTLEGVFVLRRTLIPIARVQHVETRRDVWEQALGLATVAIYTAAGGHAIPLLREADAARVRSRIGELARLELEAHGPDA